MVCCLVAFVGSALVSVFVIWPEPRIHDEFAYLLAADTFASGRLTNPTHPMWQHFESFHIFHEPTYQSKYPPAQGLILALGIVVGSHPVVGLWLSAALLCGSVCWMLYALVDQRWALIGGLATAAQIGIASYWTQTYWGGALAAAGGALVYGAAARLASALSVSAAAALAVGLLLLANSRPFEGATVAVPAVVVVALGFWRMRRSADLRRAVIPLVAILAFGFAAMAYFNHSVTGSWRQLPYLHHDQAYSARPLFHWQRAPETAPVQRHTVLRQYWVGSREGERAGAPTKMSHRGVVSLEDVDELRGLFLGRVLLIPFLVGALSLWRRDVRMAVVGIVLVLVAARFTVYYRIHYVAPLAAPVFALAIIGLARLSKYRLGRLEVGCAFAASVVLCLVGSCLLDAYRLPHELTYKSTDDFPERRAAVVRTLESSPGPDLVVVQYGPRHDIHREWVYNAADIDAADIVWARGMGAEKDHALRGYFRDRRAWLLREGFGDETDGLTALGAPADRRPR